MTPPEIETIGIGTFIVTCACATLGMMVSVCFLIFHIYHRDNKIVKMSSPYLNILTSIGANLLSVVCFMYGLDYILATRLAQLTVLCQLRVWLLVLSITLVYGPVVTKSWRVYEIFKYGCAKKVVIRDRRLLFMICCVLLVDCTLMVLWQTIDPVTTRNTWTIHMILDDHNNSIKSNSSYAMHECTCTKQEVWIAFITLWKSVLIASCLFYAWKIRNVAVPCLNDSVYTIAAIFVSVFLALCTSISVTSLRGNPDVVYILTTVAISGAVIIVQLILFLPKVKYWWKTPDNVSPRISSASLKSFPGQPGGDVNANTYQDDGLVNIVEENKLLKESLLEKENLITALQSHIYTAKEKIHMLPTEFEIKQDSGVDDNDNSCDDNDDLYDTLRSPEVSPTKVSIDVIQHDRSRVYRVDGTPLSEEHDFHNTEDFEPQHRKTNLKSSPSFHSVGSRRSFVFEFTDIRDSIAAELDCASYIHTDLRESLHRDNERCYSETEWLYERSESKELAGSIAQSYNLADTPDTFSYINAHLPRDNSVFQIKKSRRMSGSSVLSESMSDRSVDLDNISSDITSSAPRDSETPNSQQHAAILRYYSYRHMNDDLDRFKNSNRLYKDSRPSSVRFTSRIKQTANQTAPKEPPVIYSVPNTQHKKAPVLASRSMPTDSFV